MLLAALVVVVFPTLARAEVSELRIPLGAGGFGFLPLYMMQKYKLIEKYAAESGATITVNWADLGSASLMNDILLSGTAHIISAGPPGFLTLWDRTQSNMKVKGIAALSTLPVRITARFAELSSIDAVTQQQKIAVGAVKVSIASILMQMYAQKKYGKDQTYKFDLYTVPLPHPDALIALLSGTGGVVAHGSSVPFDSREMKDPRVKTILSSYDVLGGPATFTMMSTTTKFYNENPKIMAAVHKALARAQEMIRDDKTDAAKVLLESMGGKGWSVDDLVQILNDPTTIYTSKPEGVLAYAAFMYDAGSIKHKPEAIDELFFPAPAIAGGN
ncbi:MAG: ABC transporter substrate-binding protein [Pseudolabrys sp.]